jgi:hypothetical protein
MENLIEKAKENIINYYNLVDIKKTKGFTDKIGKHGLVKGEDLNYQIPKEAEGIQKEIMIMNNKMIESGEITEFNSWLSKYERKLKYS